MDKIKLFVFTNVLNGCYTSGLAVATGKNKEEAIEKLLNRWTQEDEYQQHKQMFFGKIASSYKLPENYSFSELEKSTGKSYDDLIKEFESEGFIKMCHKGTWSSNYDWEDYDNDEDYEDDEILHDSNNKKKSDIEKFRQQLVKKTPIVLNINDPACAVFIGGGD